METLEILETLENLEVLEFLETFETFEIFEPETWDRLFASATLMLACKLLPRESLLLRILFICSMAATVRDRVDATLPLCIDATLSFRKDATRWGLANDPGPCACG